MQSIKRLEIIVGSAYVNNITEFFDEKQISGYTIFDSLRGRGNRGLNDGEGLTDAFNNSLILVFCTPNELEVILEPIRKYLKKVGGVCALSDAEWLSH